MPTAPRFAERDKAGQPKEMADDTPSEKQQETTLGGEPELESGPKGKGTKKVAAKTPRGTRDFHPADMRARSAAIAIISRVYERHGAVQIETPTFELTEVLNGKYGDEGQGLIYNLERKNESHEALSLRYDLTVPFARYLATHNIATMKRYQLGRVFRREETCASRGRYREFYQCDFDYAGRTAPMVADAECIAIMVEQLEELGLAPFVVKVSDRALLEVLLERCGVPPAQRRTVCSSIDKLDKQSWETVRAELVNSKGVDAGAAAQIGRFAEIRGSPRDVLAKVREFLGAAAPAGPEAGRCRPLEEMELLAGYLECLGCASRVQFDLSLARGLDYYTGVVFEAVHTGGGSVGSLAGGGRYDNLLGIFRGGPPVPAVGFALGIERIFDLFGKRAAQEAQLPASDVLVISIGGFVAEKLGACRRLWAAGIRAEPEYLDLANPGKRIGEAGAQHIPIVAIIGAEEAAAGTVRVKRLETREQATIPVAELPAFVAKILTGDTR